MFSNVTVIYRKAYRPTSLAQTCVIFFIPKNPIVTAANGLLMQV